MHKFVFFLILLILGSHFVALNARANIESWSDPRPVSLSPGNSFHSHLYMQMPQTSGYMALNRRLLTRKERIASYSPAIPVEKFYAEIIPGLKTAEAE